MEQTELIIDDLMPEAMALCAGFERCVNFPRSDEGAEALARGLASAAARFKLPMRAIVAECLKVSQYCPTDADLWGVARDLAGPAKAEQLPAPTAETRQRWQEFTAGLPAILQNAARAEKARSDVMARIRQHVGRDRFVRMSSMQIEHEAEAMGLPILQRNAQGMTRFLPRFE